MLYNSKSFDLFTGKGFCVTSCFVPFVVKKEKRKEKRFTDKYTEYKWGI